MAHDRECPSGADMRTGPVAVNPFESGNAVFGHFFQDAANQAGRNVSASICAASHQVFAFSILPGFSVSENDPSPKCKVATGKPKVRISTNIPSVIFEELYRKDCTGGIQIVLSVHVQFYLMKSKNHLLLKNVSRLSFGTFINPCSPNRRSPCFAPSSERISPVNGRQA